LRANNNNIDQKSVEKLKHLAPGLFFIDKPGNENFFFIILNSNISLKNVEEL